MSGSAACFLVIVALIAIGVVVNYFQEKAHIARQREIAIEQERRERDERKKREAWEKSPEGIRQLALERAELLAEKKAQRQREEETARARWASWHSRKSLQQIALMTGLEFERFLAQLLTRLGYSNIRLTPRTDQGGDLLATTPSGESLVVQAKRWRKSVGNKAVQELLGALLMYGCAKGAVITNSTFTKPAIKLAKKDRRIALFDQYWLREQIDRAFPEKTPEFTWEGYRDLLIKHPEAGVAEPAHATDHSTKAPRPRWKRKWRRH